MKNRLFSDLLALTKPRLNLLALLTTLAGFYMACFGDMDKTLLFWALFGATAVAAGCGTLNQWLEAEADKRMPRTQQRPLPGGRMQPSHALLFGLFLSVMGVLVLYLKVNTLTAFLGLGALVSYILLYTPLKKISPLCTLVGALPGALPPLMGWTAVQGAVDFRGMSLFWILFLWQMPHFFAIGWMYRDDYAKAGFPMLSVVDPKGGLTGLMAVAFSAALLPISLVPVMYHMAGSVYFWSALVLGLGLLAFSLFLAKTKTLTDARRLFWASITYLPLLFAVMALDKI